MPACFDTIGKGMDTVPTRFDAIQVYNSRYLNILTLKISGSFIGANTVHCARPYRMQLCMFRAYSSIRIPPYEPYAVFHMIHIQSQHNYRFGLITHTNGIVVCILSLHINCYASACVVQTLHTVLHTKRMLHCCTSACMGVCI